MRVILIGNPEHRRTKDFQAALAEAGQPAAEVVSYASLIEDPTRLLRLDPGRALVRQDSFGQDFEVERGLLRLGYAAARDAGASRIAPADLETLGYARGRIVAPRQLHFGFLAVLRSIEQSLDERPAWDVLQSPSGIRRCFDKPEASAHWQNLGLPVPPRLAAQHHSELRGRVFVKLGCGSSASCIAVFHTAGRYRIVDTTVEVTPNGLFNSRRLRRYEDDATIERLWAFLHGEGIHIERAMPRASVDGTPFDLRIVVVEGEPAFTVMRCSRGPMTNLHLGGKRGDWSRFAPRVPASTWQAITESCRTIAQDTRCFSLGLDVLLSPDLSRHTVIEANAFGDLLPGIERDGHSVYRWQVERMLERWNRDPGAATSRP